MAQALPLVGGVVGAYFGGMIGMPQLGWMIGSAAGSLLESAIVGPPVPPNALTDLQVQTSSWGQGLPQIFGTQRIAGNIIWATDKVLVNGDQGKFGGKGGGGGKGAGKGGGVGKKGGGAQGYYIVGIAIALCEGPIGGIKRIWAAGDLIFDDGQPVYVPSTNPDEPKGGYQTFTANNQPIVSTGGSSLGNWTLYHGTMVQNADPTIVANGSGNGVEGVPYQKVTLQNGFTYSYGSPQYGKLGTACAYRGLAYIVFDALNCGYGGSIPPLTFEVVGQPGALGAPTVIMGPIQLPFVSTQAASVINNGDYAVFANIASSTTKGCWVNLNNGQIVPITSAWSWAGNGSLGDVGGLVQYGNAVAMAANMGPQIADLPNGAVTKMLAQDYYYGAGSWENITNLNGTLWLYEQFNYFCSPSLTSGVDSIGMNTPTGVVHYPEMIRITPPGNPSSGNFSGNFPVIGDNFYYFSGTTLYQCAPPSFLAITTSLPYSPGFPWTDGSYIYAPCGNSIYQVNPTTGAISLYLTVTVASQFYCFGNGWLFGYGAIYGGLVYPLIKYNSDGSIRYAVATGIQGGNKNGCNPIIPVKQGIMVSGNANFGAGIAGAFAIYSYGDIELTAIPVTLPSVIQTICQRAGFTNVDVSLVPTSILINMTRRAGTSARDFLKVLCQTYMMDMVDSAGTLRFVPKGQPIIGQLSYDQIGFSKPTNQGASPAAPYAWTRGQGTDLPRSVTFKYTSALANYNPTSQFFQLHDSYGNDVSINVPMTLDDKTALTAAMLMCVMPQIENMVYAWSCAFNKLQYEAGDVLQMPWGVTRITQVTLSQIADVPTIDFLGVIDASYVINSGYGTASAVPLPQLGQPTVYQSALPVASSGSLIATQLQPSAITTNPPTRPPLNVGTAYGAFLEVPPLTSQDTTPFYFVAPWTTGNTFVGAAIFESTDGGTTFNQIAQQSTPGIVGWTPGALASTQPYTWDTVSTVSVYLNAAYMQLSGATDLQVIQGANLAQLGTELIQFANAQLMTDAQGNAYYQLSRLLRGRRGTESQMGTHVAGETFILIQSNDEAVIDYGLHDLNNQAEFKTATVGQNLSSINATEFAPAGLWYKPFSPSHLAVSLDTSNNWNAVFTPRARLNGWWGSGYAPILDTDTTTWSADILNGSTVKRTLTGSLSTPSFQYTAAMQTTDGFTPGQHGIVMNIYQVGQLGRGYIATVTT